MNGLVSYLLVPSGMTLRKLRSRTLFTAFAVALCAPPVVSAGAPLHDSVSGDSRHVPFAASTPPRSDECDVVRELLPVTEVLRGLSALHPIECRVASPDEFARLTGRMATDQIDFRRLRFEQRVLRLLGFLPEDFDYLRCMSPDAAEVSFGFYDSAKRMMILRSDVATPRSVLVHELTHALQDQHFNLTRIRSSANETDRILAQLAVIEGDAIVIEELIRRIDPKRDDQQREAVRRLSSSGCLFPKPLVELFAFPSQWGSRFVGGAYSKGGQPMVDRLFRKLPRTTAEIFASEQATEPRERTKNTPAPKIAIASEMAYRDVMGKYPVWVLLKYFVGARNALGAVQGLEDDELRYRVMHDGAASGELSWRLRYRTHEAALTGHASFGQYLQSRFGITIEESVRRIRFTSSSSVSGELSVNDDLVTLVLRRPMTEQESS